MAFLNYLAQGTYSTVDNFRYDPVGNRCQWTLNIYSDSRRQTVLASKEFEAGMYAVNYNIKDLAISNNPPESPQDGDGFYVGQSRTGAWAGFYGNYARFSSETGWSFWGAAPWQIYKHDGKYYRCDGVSFIEVDCLVDDDKWNQFLSKGAAHAPGTNITRQIYLIMKTLPSMAGVTSDE